MTPFGATVRLWRLERGWTQDQLARAARIPRPNLSAIERGQRDVNLRTLRALAAALHIRPGILADGESPPVHHPKLGFSRLVLERVARSAIDGTLPKDKGERSLVLLLQSLIQNKIGAATNRRVKQPSRRATYAAWLRLRACYPEPVFKVLLRKIDKHLSAMAQDSWKSTLGHGYNRTHAQDLDS